MDGPPSVFPCPEAQDRGAPCYPLLYALAAEPLAVAICAHPKIVGLSRGEVTETISNYTDDTLLYLEYSDVSLPTALTLTERFGTFSGLRIK